MNVQVPTVIDLANSLPSGWKDIDGPSPNQAWLNQFWTMFTNHQWQEVPPALTAFYLVPLVGDKLQTLLPKHLLATTHLSSLSSLSGGSEQPAEADSNTAAKVLTAVGCDCISEPRANIVSSISARLEPVMVALANVANTRIMRVQHLVSLQHLGASTFNGLCDILAKLDIPEGDQSARNVLRQCTVFEDIRGTPVALSKR